MRIIALIAVIVPLSLSSGGTIAHPHSCTVQPFRAFSSKVWSPSHWQRGKPKPTALQGKRKKLSCAGPGHRKAMKKQWTEDRRLFGRYRLYRQVATFPAPPGVGSGPRRPSDKRWWSIPAYIVCGESRYRFHPWENSDGAYQIIPSTWESAGGTEFASTAGEATPLEQHIIADILWGTTPWYGAC